MTIMVKGFNNKLPGLLKILLLFIFVISMSGCAATHHRSKNDRKKGLMLLENTSQSMNKKYKKTRFAKKSQRRHKRNHGLK